MDFDWESDTPNEVKATPLTVMLGGSHTAGSDSLLENMMRFGSVFLNVLI